MQADCALEQTLGASQSHRIHVNANQTDNPRNNHTACRGAGLCIVSHLVSTFKASSPAFGPEWNAHNRHCHMQATTPFPLTSDQPRQQYVIKKPELTHTYRTAAASCPCGGDCLHSGCATGIWGCSETLNPCLSWNSKNLNYK